ncbi:hypothetical protein PMAYCL1PPCAC_19426 [Pristionchus mayeri]|uniref:Uncharacterized protein n=1 Tax=Pristionchus mayeri TaxID=1317129 RepID=A0AAN5I347_9BILA|nr:hypothetical protein PMAYCL1PPCAC_19426 [Pristionchus mayeri]
MSCDECKEGDDYLIFNNDDDGKKCTVKSTTAGLIYAKDKTTNEMTCTNNTGKYEWKTEDGDPVTEFAAKTSKPPASFSTGAIIGIVAGVLIVLAIPIVIIGIVLYRRKQKALAAERLKSKGLEQKMDSIIDNVTVTDDVKTLVI